MYKSGKSEVSITTEKQSINGNATVKIVIATHKKYWMPKDTLYLPLHVGAEGKTDEKGNPLDFGYVKDNTGENISELNSSFCELTGLYWAWKNLDTDYIGLTHYRRHFVKGRDKNPFQVVLKEKDIKADLGKVKVFVPKKRKYYIETIYNHYKHTHYANQLDLTREIIQEKYPGYIAAYDRVVKRTYGYMFNMLIMEKELLNQYCTWMFDILFELKNRIDMPELSAYQGRFYGRVSEIIFNVWLEKQLMENRIKHSEIRELAWTYMEHINGIQKGIFFLKAKFLNVKYERSF